MSTSATSTSALSANSRADLAVLAESAAASALFVAALADLTMAPLCPSMIFAWSRMCLACQSIACPTCRLKVSPPIVTLTASQPQMFTANTEVTWSTGVQPNGLYLAPDKVNVDQRLVVTATSSADSKRLTSADVFL